MPVPVALDKRVEPILRNQLIANAARTQRNAQDPPVTRTQGQQIVDIDRLMRAVESADAQMDNADAMRRGVMAKYANIGG